MEKIYCYVVLSNTGTVLSRVIRYYSGEKYVHSSITFDPSLKLMYSFGRKHPSNPIIAGYIHEDINTGLFLEMKNIFIRVYRIEITEKQLSLLKEKIQEFDSNMGKYQYNLVGLLDFKINKTLKVSENYYFCSEFVSKLLRYAGIIKPPKPDGLMRPRDLVRGQGFEKIFQGKLTKYKRLLKKV
ncbi:MAG: hypothetical protein WCP14_04200 [bacterium]